MILKFPDRYISRIIIFAGDVIVCCLSIFIAYLLRFNFHIPENELQSLRYVFPFVISIRIISFYIFKTYSGIIRYTSTRDAVRILGVVAAGSVFFGLVNPLSYR